MNKRVDLIEEEGPTFSDRLLEFLVSKRKAIVYSSLALIICITLTYRIVDGKRLGYEKAIMEAKLTENSLMRADSENLAQDIEKLNSIITSHSDLSPLYLGTTAQAQLLQGNTSEAEKLLAQSSSATPMHFRSFSDASLLISQEKLTDALSITESLSLALDQKLSDEEKAASPLYLMNSTRLAFLYQTLDDTKLEQAQWKKVLSLLNSSKQLQNPLNQRVADMFHHTYSEGNISLVNYAEKRIN